MVLFAFTTLLGNLYYVDNAIIYMNKKKEPSKQFMKIFYVFCTLIVFVGAMIPMDAAWAMADITMYGDGKNGHKLFERLRKTEKRRKESCIQGKCNRIERAGAGLLEIGKNTLIQ